MDAVAHSAWEKKMNRAVKSLLMAMLAITFAARAGAAHVEDDFNTLFGPEAKKTAATKTTKDDADFAASLLAAAGKVGNRTDLKIFILDKARQFAITDPAGYDTAVEALKKLHEVCPQRKLEWDGKLAAVWQLRYSRARGAERSAAGQSLLKQLITVADASLAAGRTTKAAGFYRQALTLAGVLRSPRKSEVVARLKAANARLVVERKIASLRRRLETDPGDRKTRETLIQLCLVELDNPAEAAKLLNDDVGEFLRTYVSLAARPIGEVAEGACLELGAWYEQVSKKATSKGKASALARARKYYQHYLTRHTKQDLSRVKATMALARVNKALSELAKAGIISPSAFGTVGQEVTKVTPVGHYIQVWRVLPKHAKPGRYRVSIKHAAGGAAGGFFITAWADTDGNGAPDTHIGSSPRICMKQAGQWSSWAFQTKHKNVFVGNFWLKPSVRLYYQSGGALSGHTGLSREMYYSHSAKKPPDRRTSGPRYTNIRVETIDN